VYVSAYVSNIKTKTSDRNDLKLGTVVVLNIVSKPIDFWVQKVKGVLWLGTAERICISTEYTFYTVSRKKVIP